jgi:hypothetical protein
MKFTMRFYYYQLVNTNADWILVPDWLIDWLINWVFTPLSAVFQLYQGDQFLMVEEAGVPGENHRTWASNW